jgi:hypothetical protein
VFRCFLVKNQSQGNIMALNRHGFRERRLRGSLNTILNDRRWPGWGRWSAFLCKLATIQWNGSLDESIRYVNGCW